MADAVMRMPEPQLQRQPVEEEEEVVQTELLSDEITPLIQRQEETEIEEGEEELVQTKTITEQSTPLIQRRVEEEEEEELSGNATPGIQRMVEPKSEEESIIQPKRLSAFNIQHVNAKSTEEIKTSHREGPPIQTKAEGASTPSISPNFQRTIQLSNGGLPLTDTVRSRIEPVLGADLGNVRVHSDANSNDAAKSLQAKAFTHQNHIWLASGESPEDITLMAHEATHVVQQTGSESGTASVRCSPGDNEGSFWSSVGEGIVSGGRTLLSYGQAGVTAVGEGISIAVETGDEVVSGAVGMAHDAIIGFLEERAPGALAFFRGLRNFVREGVTTGFDSIFSGVAESYQEGGIGGALEYIFVDLAGGALRGIGSFIAGSCNALGDAANWLIDVGTRLGSEAIAAVTTGATVVASFLTGLWEQYGAPAAEAIRGFIGGIWDSITETVSKWWDLLEPIRTASREVWDWLVSTIMEGIQSLNDLLTRVFAWAVEKWDEIKEQIRPFMGYVKAVAVILLLLSPMGPFVAASAAVYGLYRLIQYLWQVWGQPMVAEIRQRLADEVLPQIMIGIAFVEQKIDEAKEWLTGFADDLVNLGMELLSAIGVLPVLHIAQRVISSIHAEFQRFTKCIRATFELFADGVHQLLQSAYQFLQPIIEFMRQLVLVALFGPLSILDDGVWETVNRIANLAMTVPCIREIARLMQLPLILEYAGQFRTVMKNAWQIIQNPEPIWQALHDALAPMIESVPGITASIMARMIYPHEEQHRRGVEAYLLPAIEHLQGNWWQELKKMGGTLLWPWGEVAERFPLLLQHGWGAITNLFDLEIGAAADKFLLMVQDVNMILGAVWGWFALAAVLIGGVLGALGVEFTAGASIGVGMAAGWALAAEVGIVLLAVVAGTEMAIIGKAMFDIRFTNAIIENDEQRSAANNSDYRNIANSTFTLAVLTALVVLGALAGKLASSIWSKVKRTAGLARRVARIILGPRALLVLEEALARIRDRMTKVFLRFKEGDRTRLKGSGVTRASYEGPARKLHPERFEEILADLERNGVEINLLESVDPWKGSYQPGLRQGRPGQVRVHRDVDLRTLEHEYNHFLDDLANEYPGLQYYIENPKEMYNMERVAYEREMEMVRNNSALSAEEKAAIIQELEESLAVERARYLD